MKEEHCPHPHHQHPRRLLHLIFSPKLFTKATVYILLLTLSYAFGFFSASTALTKPSPDFKTPRRPDNSDSLNPNHDLFRFNTRCADPVPSKFVRQTILDRVYNGTSPFDGFPPPHAAPLLREKRIKGWGSTGAVFENLIRKVQPRTIVEVGTFLGASAIHMAELTRRLGLKTQILCVDDFRGWPGFRGRFRDLKMVNGDVTLMYQFMQNVAHVNATEIVLHVPHSSASALAKMCEWGVYADLIEVDAGHYFHSAWADINRAYAILRPGGVLFGHDYFTAEDNRGVRRAVNLFAKAKGLRVEIDGEHWVIASR
ncbi:uncharacterized protein LOC131233313 [Magnolia sinica]|uniref:uncharacterized protein LOC131233313 n=1 Tax=Magnolia sinica TaxID=86752 RepID=UPI00265855A2|nr:uncharacterized protein LOC131233313 [Magnolia sinica]